MDVVLFESAEKQKFNAGSKARKDALRIAINCGYSPVILFHNGKSKLTIVFELVKGCVSAIAKAKKGENILIQYPYSPMLLNKILFGVLSFAKKIKGYNVLVLIHDLKGLRNNDRNLLRKELKMMKNCDVIYHNECMMNECEKIFHVKSYQILGVFDYLYTGEICKREYSTTPVVMIAGKLSKEKCGYAYQLSDIDGVRFDLFGTNYSGSSSDKVRYRGKYDPDELISHLDGQFGLVWDGDTIDTCGGTSGNYLRYNNPHKLSLYIAAGVPLIVWNQSALADYVLQNGLGICVDNLRDLQKKLQTITYDEYYRLCHNVLIIRKEIIAGDLFKRIIMI